MQHLWDTVVDESQATLVLTGSAVGMSTFAEDLLSLLAVEFSTTRLNACCALGYAGVDEAVPRLEELAADDPEEAVRRAAEDAIALLGA